RASTPCQASGAVRCARHRHARLTRGQRRSTEGPPLPLLSCLRARPSGARSGRVGCPPDAPGLVAPDVPHPHGQRTRDGRRGYVMSYLIGSAYPLINYSGVRSASRFAQLWVLPAAYIEQLQGASPLRYRAPAEMGPSERFLNQAVFEDLRDQRPRLLVILRN